MGEIFPRPMSQKTGVVGANNDFRLESGGPIFLRRGKGGRDEAQKQGTTQTVLSGYLILIKLASLLG
jgi:hypothetical protein